ncbi:hypothetical protein U1Q18_002762 [Sarracenia purpurea var. burkii]
MKDHEYGLVWLKYNWQNILYNTWDFGPQYPVSDKPAAPIRMSSLLTSRHLSQKRIRLPARKCVPQRDGTKVPFFSNEVKAPTAHKADALFVPRENPRAYVISPLVHSSLHEYVNGNISADVSAPAFLNGSMR